MKRLPVILLLLLFCFQGYAQHAITTGPEKGTLLLIGGHASDELFLPKFAELVGGTDKPIVLIPTARRKAAVQYEGFLERQVERFREFGFTDVTILHTRDSSEANKQSFVKPLEKAWGVWIMGGRQWRLTDAYLNTLTHREMKALLNRGGVIAGTSAGASVQASYLVRGDTETNTVMMGDHEKGFGFIGNIAVDQHLLARNRHFDMFRILEEKPHLLGVGLDENTGIIVRRDTFEVVGESYVAIYDGTRWSAEKDTIYDLAEGEEQFYFLDEGNKYDMRQRKVVK
jgi:cyanophycinase